MWNFGSIVRVMLTTWVPSAPTLPALTAALTTLSDGFGAAAAWPATSRFMAKTASRRAVMAGPPGTGSAAAPSRAGAAAAIILPGILTSPPGPHHANSPARLSAAGLLFPRPRRRRRRPRQGDRRPEEGGR